MIQKYFFVRLHRQAIGLLTNLWKMAKTYVSHKNLPNQKIAFFYSTFHSLFSNYEGYDRK